MHMQNSQTKNRYSFYFFFFWFFSQIGFGFAEMKA